MPQKCKHGLTKSTCAYCQGYKPPKDYRKPGKGVVYMLEEQFNHAFSRTIWPYNIGGVEERFGEGSQT